MRVYYDRDADIELIKTRKVAIAGYGSQGHAHAANLRDSGIRELAVALRADSASWKRAEEAGFKVMTTAEAAAWADVVVLLAPDEHQAAIWAENLEPNMRKGAALLFAHGLNIHFGLIKPREDLDILMVAPKGAGRLVRAEYLRGGGIPCLVAVHRNASGQAFDLALSYAVALGGGRSGIMETTFREECETDLFSEQVVLCGGLTRLIHAAFETLVEAGYSPEAAYFECLHEVKLIADLIYEKGIAGMRHAISNTAEYGGYKAGPRIITDETKAEMRRILADIQEGRFVRDFILDHQAGSPELKASRSAEAAHPIEEVGAGLRAMMPWIAEHKGDSRKKT